MPKRSSSDDPVVAAHRTMEHILAKHDPEYARTVRIRKLERLCREVAEFARVGGLPERVITVLATAGAGGPIDAKFLLPITLEDFPKESPAVSLGRAGGLKGGHARAKALSKKRRAEIARDAAATRWKSVKNKT